MIFVTPLNLDERYFDFAWSLSHSDANETWQIETESFMIRMNIFLN